MLWFIKSRGAEKILKQYGEQWLTKIKPLVTIECSHRPKHILDVRQFSSAVSVRWRMVYWWSQRWFMPSGGSVMSNVGAMNNRATVSKSGEKTVQVVDLQHSVSHRMSPSIIAYLLSHLIELCISLEMISWRNCLYKTRMFVFIIMVPEYFLRLLECQMPLQWTPDGRTLISSEMWFTRNVPLQQK